MVEVWKSIVGFEGMYEVSDLGRVRSVDRISTSRGFLRPLKGKLLTQSDDSTGNYLKVRLCKNGKMFNKRVHVLVATAFVPNPCHLPQVNHLGEKSDNRAIRLEWRSSAGHGRDKSKRNQAGDGVCFAKQTGKWKAYYNPAPRKQKWIGQRYSSYEEAKAARDKAVAELPNLV